jgi:predicted glycosyltransferase
MLLTARLLRIPSIHIGDYEHTKELVSPDWYVIPSVIPKSAIHLPPDRVHTYPGIKEDVYAPTFRPDASVFTDLNIPQDKIIAVIRPPAVEAHYHNPESEKLFEAAIEHLSKSEDLIMIVLPRYAKQGHEIRSVYKDLVEKHKMIIPDKVYDGLNIIWFSDFVVSGGGTMNREAAALNVPVYSIFRGTIGAVDKYLSESSRLVLLTSVDDVKNKIKVQKRDRLSKLHTADNSSLNVIVGIIMKMWDEWYGA